MELEHISAIQDDITYRRVTAWELQRLTEEIAGLHAQTTRARSPLQWMLPALFGCLLAGAVGYIGIVHQIAIRNVTKIEQVSDEQQRRMYMEKEIEVIRKRLADHETTMQQIPYLTGQLRDNSVKLDKLLDRGPR